MRWGYECSTIGTSRLYRFRIWSPTHRAVAGPGDCAWNLARRHCRRL